MIRWYPLGDDDEFLDSDGHAETEAANSLHKSMTADDGMGLASGAGSITVTGYDDHHGMLVTMSCIHRPTELLLIVVRNDGSTAYFTDQPPPPPSPD